MQRYPVTNQHPASIKQQTAMLLPSPVVETIDKASTTKQQKRRKVHFAFPIAVKHTSIWDDHQFHLDDFKLFLWWSRDEFVKIMAKAVATSAEARKHTLLSQAIESAVTFAGREARCLGDNTGCITNYLVNMDDTDRGLRLWCQYGHSRRGLERITSRIYYETKKQDRVGLVQQIVALSKEGAKSEFIRMMSERKSRPYVIFARMLGIADANAALAQPGFPNVIRTAHPKSAHSGVSSAMSQIVVSKKNRLTEKGVS